MTNKTEQDFPILIAHSAGMRNVIVNANVHMQITQPGFFQTGAMELGPQDCHSLLHIARWGFFMFLYAFLSTNNFGCLGHY